VQEEQDRLYHRRMEIQDRLDPALVARLRKGIKDAEEGKTHDLGDFSHHLTADERAEAVREAATSVAATSSGLNIRLSEH
jgi:hypothetical protein